MPPVKKEDDPAAAEATASSLGLEEEKEKEKARKVQDMVYSWFVSHIG